jgi:hypothetical protein
MSCNFCLFFKEIVAKTYFLKVLNGALFLWILHVFLSRLLNQKMTSATLNISFHIYLGRFVGDWICIIHILEY